MHPVEVLVVLEVEQIIHPMGVMEILVMEQIMPVVRELEILAMQMETQVARGVRLAQLMQHLPPRLTLHLLNPRLSKQRAVI